MSIISHHVTISMIFVIMLTMMLPDETFFRENWFGSWITEFSRLTYINLHSFRYWQIQNKQKAILDTCDGTRVDSDLKLYPEPDCAFKL